MFIRNMFHITGIILFVLQNNLVNGLIDGLYCGKHDCYAVLGVSRKASKADIAKTYRQLAKKYHPDTHKTAEAKQKAAETFTLISTAYEVLKDEESRKDYDYMLDNPDTVYSHYYRYYHRRMSPKVDARVVIATLITVVSIIQYFVAWSRYKSVINHLVTVPKYRLKAIEIAKQEKLLDINKKRDKRKKEQIKVEEDSILKKILEEMMERGGYSKPLITDLLWIQLIFFPYTVLKYIYWNIRWLWKFNFLKQDYGYEEKLYLIKKHLQCSTGQWNVISDKEKESYLEEGLWIKKNFDKWKQQKEDDIKVKLAESAKYKSYRRYMKNHGPGQISLDDM